ncbi:TetR family transcriptional regulator, partial [Mycobacterium sp. ITM-2017-0098]
VVRRYVAVLSAAFAPRTLTTTTRKGEQSHA